MRIVGRHAIELEKENMIRPTPPTYGEEWTPEFIRFCIGIGSNYLQENLDLYEIFHNTDSSLIQK